MLVSGESACEVFGSGMVDEDENEDDGKEDEKSKEEDNDEGRVWMSLVLVVSGITTMREVRLGWRKKGEFTVDGEE